MTRRLIALAMVATAAAAGCANGDPSPSQPPGAVDLELGRRVYDANCAACHGSSGRGGIGPALGDGAVVQRYPDPADHRDVVVNGRGRMPAWGNQLSDEEIDAVVAYERDGL